MDQAAKPDQAPEELADDPPQEDPVQETLPGDQDFLEVMLPTKVKHGEPMLFRGKDFETSFQGTSSPYTALSFVSLQHQM